MSCLIPFRFGNKGGYNVPHTHDDKIEPVYVPRIRSEIEIPEIPKIIRDEYLHNTPVIYQEDTNVEPKVANPDNNSALSVTLQQNSNTDNISAPNVTPQQNDNTDNKSAPKVIPRQNGNTDNNSAPKVTPQQNGNIDNNSAPKVTPRQNGNTDNNSAPKVTPQQNGNTDNNSAPKVTPQQNGNVDNNSAPEVTPRQNGNTDNNSAPKVTHQQNGNTDNNSTPIVTPQQNGNTDNNSAPIVTPQQNGNIDTQMPEVPVRKQKKSVGFDNTPTIMLKYNDENPITNMEDSNVELIITNNDKDNVPSNGNLDLDKIVNDNSKEIKKQVKREKKTLKAELKKAKENTKENTLLSSSFQEGVKEEIVDETKKLSSNNQTGDSQESSSDVDDVTAPLKPKKRPAISKDYAAQDLSDVKYTKYEKDHEATALIKKALLANDFIKNLMDEERLISVVEAMHSEEYEVGSFIIKEGDQGSHLFVSAEGNFEVFKEGKSVKLIGPGEVFGELAILYKSKRFASVKVTRKAKVWVLERSVFKKIMWTTRKQEQENNLKFLSRVPILKNVHPTDLIKISDLLKRQFFLAGMKIVAQGEKGDDFYIIRGGTVSITKRPPGGGPEEHVGNLFRGDYFGEQALLHEDHRLATVTAKAPGAECLVLERKPFHKFLGNIKELTETYHRDKIPSTSKSKNEKPFVFTSEYDHIKLEELEIIGTLGEGAFGRVEMVQYTENKSKVFALKCLKKADIVHEHNQERAYNEKNIMIRCNSPFVCKLYNTYKDRKYVYFLMEPVLGGDVFSMMSRMKFLAEPAARFMTACVVEALEHLHGLDIIYRDLKPENLMLDSKGYVKVVDFGCSKFLSIGTKTDTVVGTPEYLAPELIRNMGHDRAVDYWALGIFIHELLLGRPPFRHQNPSRTLKLILKGIDSVVFDPRIGRVAQALIKQLCRPIAVERLGYAKNGFKDIKDHDWFKDFKWEKLRSRKMKAPIVPSLKNMSKYPKIQVPPDETSNWDADF